MSQVSPEQRTVVESAEDRIAVRAAAGSGKTRVLVDRYVRHVVDLGQSPEEVAALTFTKKAAAEMKGRIVSRLRDAGLSEAAQAAETGPVQTVHSFCERLLRESAIEARVSPTFEVLEDSAGDIVFEEAVRWAVAGALDGDGPASRLLRALAGKLSWDDTPALHSRIRKMVLGCAEKVRASGLGREFWLDRYATPESTLSYWKSQAAAAFPGSDLPEGWADADDWGRLLGEALKSSGQRVPGWLKSQDPVSDKLAAWSTCGLVQLVCAAWSWLDEEMDSLQRFDFIALESKTIQLVESDPVVAARLRSQFKAVLVDEAQDLSPLQYRLIDRLGASSELMVGDPQQSIYGFRFAERRLFVERCEDLGSYPLSKNYRSETGILSFVDQVFDGLWGAAYSPMATRSDVDDDPFASGCAPCDGVEVWPLASIDFRSVARLVGQLVEEGGKLSDIAVLVQRNETVQTVAEFLTSNGIANRMVGASRTFYTRLEVRDIANALEACGDPYNEFAFLGLLRSPFVGLSMDALVWAAAHPPAVESLRDAPLSDEDRVALERFWRWFDRCTSTVPRLPAWEAMSRLMSESPYLSERAKLPGELQALANVRKLQTLAAREPDMDGRAFSRRLREIQFLRHREGEAPILDDNADAVTVMTVHRSKGLEFDTVVLAETHRSLTRRKRDFETDAPSGLVAAAPEKRCCMINWLHERAAQSELEESLRVLYVGMTRAKRRLCLVTSESGSHTSLAGILAKHSGLPHQVLNGVKVRRLDDR